MTPARSAERSATNSRQDAEGIAQRHLCDVIPCDTWSTRPRKPAEATRETEEARTASFPQGINSKSCLPRPDGRRHHTLMGDRERHAYATLRSTRIHYSKRFGGGYV